MLDLGSGGILLNPRGWRFCDVPYISEEEIGEVSVSETMDCLVRNHVCVV